MLHRASGPVGLGVDNFLDTTDRMRRWALTEEAWQVTPVLIELRRQLAIVGSSHVDLRAWHVQLRQHGYIGVDLEPIVVPLLGPAGWFGTVTYGAEAVPCIAAERQLLALATELTVWCTEHRVSTLPDVRPLAHRQHEVAVLAASGHTNPEISDKLGISINTVKLRLKQAFERLGVANRTELANMLARFAPLDGVPPGIARRGPITVTRAEVAG